MTQRDALAGLDPGWRDAAGTGVPLGPGETVTLILIRALRVTNFQCH